MQTQPDDEYENLEPCYEPSGILYRDNLIRNNVKLKYQEPSDKSSPLKSYKLYIFRKDKLKHQIDIGRQSCYLLGRDSICDIILEHPLISKQHCCLQYRKNGLYVIDLDSSNGTLVGSVKIPASRFYELKPKDVIKIAGHEMVLMDESDIS